MDRDFVIKEIHDTNARYSDDYQRVVFLFSVIKEVFSMVVKLALSSLASWKDEEDDFSFIYVQNLKVYLDTQHEQLTQIIAQIDEQYYLEKLKTISSQIENLKHDKRLATLDEMRKKAKELKEMKDKIDEYLKIEQEFDNTDLDSMRARMKELEIKTQEYRKQLNEKKKAQTEMDDLASKLEKIDLDTRVDKLVENLDKCLSEFRLRNTSQESRLQLKLDEMNDYIAGLKDIDNRLKKMNDLLNIGLENINILHFYPEFKDDEAYYNKLEEQIKELDKKLEQAITAREQVALRLT